MKMRHLTHAGGSLSLGGLPVSYAEAVELWDDLKIEFAIARNIPQDTAVHRMDRVISMEAIANAETAARVALFQCAGWRMEAGWADPTGPDEAMKNRVRT